MKIIKILWIDSHPDDLTEYRRGLEYQGYLIDIAKTVSEVEEKLENESYDFIIMELRVFPGEDPKWIDIEDDMMEEDPDSDPYMGFELIYSILKSPNARIPLNTNQAYNPNNIIIFTVITDKDQEINNLGISPNQIIHKIHSTLTTLPELIKRSIHEANNS